MPTQLLVYKWMCDYCAHVFDVAESCVLHERSAHAQQLSGAQLRAGDTADFNHVLNIVQQFVRRVPDERHKLRQAMNILIGSRDAEEFQAVDRQPVVGGKSTQPRLTDQSERGWRAPQLVAHTLYPTYQIWLPIQCTVYKNLFHFLRTSFLCTLETNLPKLLSGLEH
jgi:hypothetical protein